MTIVAFSSGAADARPAPETPLPAGSPALSTSAQSSAASTARTSAAPRHQNTATHFGRMRLITGTHVSRVIDRALASGGQRAP